MQSALNLLDAPLEAEETAQRRFLGSRLFFVKGEICVTV